MEPSSRATPDPLVRKMSDFKIDRTEERVPLEQSGLKHECGVFGCIATGDWPSQIDVPQVICLGLVALQHRGQESAGIVTSEGKCAKHFNTIKGMGMISNIFNDDSMRKLSGNLGIGHTRYSTSAASEEVNCQPFVVHTNHGAMAVAHNGELVNCSQLREDVLARGVGLSTHSDSELITQALCLNPPEEEMDKKGGPNWVARIKHLMSLAPLSYSLVIMLKDRIYGVRDPYGNRPLCIGRIVPIRDTQINGNCVDCNRVENESDGFVISSESCGFLSIGARYVREVLPGEIVEMTRTGVRSVEIVERPGNKPQAFCIFEYVYFARSDSIFEGQMVYSVRMQCGRMLARESGVDADIISSVPESGTAAAHGFARESGIAFAEVLCKNRYVGRTFIQPSTRLRQLGVAKKFGALSENVRGKKIVLVDDSIVRGNTIGPIIKLLRDAGAKEVHIRVASPPLKYPCYMGINIPTREELIANKMDAAKLAKHVGADSLEYLSVEGLIKAVRHGMSPEIRQENIGHCTACLTGDYPEKLKWDRRGMNRRKEISYDESTDVCEEKGNAGEIYPFAFVLRMRVIQIVCGIATLLMGSVALIEEKSHFNMGMGIPAGISTVLAAGNSIYCSRGFDGYQPPSCKTQPWTKLRFLGPSVRIAGVHIILWGLATGLLVTVSVNAIRILLTGHTSSTISVLAAIECVLSVAIVTALLAVVWTDIRYNPD